MTRAGTGGKGRGLWRAAGMLCAACAFWGVSPVRASETPLKACYTVDDVPEDHPSPLRHLAVCSFHSASLDNEGARHLAVGLKYNTVLSVLNLNVNTIGPEGMKDLSKALVAKPMKDFQISYSPLGDEGHTHLALAVQTWDALDTISVHDTGLKGEGALCLGKALTGKKVLRRVYLCENPLGDEGFRHLAPAVETWKNLEVFYARDTGLTGEGAVMLGKALKNKVKMTECRFDSTGELRHSFSPELSRSFFLSLAGME